MTDYSRPAGHFEIVLYYPNGELTQAPVPMIAHACNEMGRAHLFPMGHVRHAGEGVHAPHISDPIHQANRMVSRETGGWDYHPIYKKMFDQAHKAAKKDLVPA